MINPRSPIRPTAPGAFWAWPKDITTGMVIVQVVISLRGSMLYISGDHEVNPDDYSSWQKVSTGMLSPRHVPHDKPDP